MNQPFENKVIVKVITQRIEVDSAGSVTVVEAGPVGPRGFPGDGDPGAGGVSDHGQLTGLADDDHPHYHTNARGDARYSLLGHSHPEYADFTYGVGIHGDVAQVGGTYNGDGTVTLPFISGFNLLPGYTIKVLLMESPSSSYDRGYTYTMAADPQDDDWVMQPYDAPFDFPNVGKVISVNYDFAANGSVLGLIRFFDNAWSINKASFDGHTHDFSGDYAPTSHTHGEYASASHGHTVSAIDGAQADVRESAQEYLRNEWEARTAPLMVTNQTAEVMDGSYDGTWAITRATPRGTLPHTPGGLDIQWFGRALRPYRQAEIDAAGSGLTNEPDGSFYQAFYELITLVRPSIMNDWFEWARYMSNVVSPGKGRATYFYENTITGGVAENPHNAVKDTGVEVGQPERARMTLDTGTSTLTFWNWMPYDNGDPTLEKCPRGLWWKPVFSDTHAAWASMADPELETVPPNPQPGFNEGDPEVILPWRIGIQARLEIGEFFMYEFGQTNPLVAIDEAVLETAGVGATTILQGPNTITTATATTIPGPATRYAEAGHNHDGTYSSVGHNHDGDYDPAGSASAAQAAAQAYAESVAAGLVESAPETLDTLNELAQALGDDPNFATTITNLIAEKATPADIATALLNYTTTAALTSLLEGKSDTAHNHDGAYVPTGSPLLLPNPSGQPDGKVAKVVSEAWVVGDDESGGGGVGLEPYGPFYVGATAAAGTLGNTVDDIVADFPPWIHPGQGGTAVTLTSGRVYQCPGIVVNEGDIITHIRYYSGSNTSSGLTNQWFLLMNQDRVIVAITVDDGSTAWPSNSAKTLALTSPLTITEKRILLPGLMIAGATIPNLRGQAITGSVIAAPIGMNTNSTGMTTPPDVGSGINSGGGVVSSGIPYVQLIGTRAVTL